MRVVLHLLPHPGGGAEAYVDALGGLDGYRHERLALSSTRSRPGAIGSLAVRRRRARRLAGAADIVHAHGDSAALLSLGALRRGPSVVTTHGLHRLRRSRPRTARWLARSIAGAADRTICTSAGELTELASLLPSPLRSRLVAVPNGVPPRQPVDPAERGRARGVLGIGEGELAAIFVGRLEERKDPLAAVAGVEAARARGAPLVLLVAGEGPLAGDVTAGGAGTRLLGFQRDLRGLYAAADLFLAPSRLEGMSLALLDAMSYGLPIVASDIPGNVEALGPTGALFPCHDVRGLADRLLELVADPAARAALGDSARTRAAEQLSDRAFRLRTGTVYEQVLEGVPGPRAPGPGGVASLA